MSISYIEIGLSFLEGLALIASPCILPVDPTWMRLIFLLFLILGGCALLIYLLLWLIVPLEPY